HSESSFKESDPIRRVQPSDSQLRKIFIKAGAHRHMWLFEKVRHTREPSSGPDRANCSSGLSATPGGADRNAAFAESGTAWVARSSRAMTGFGLGRPPVATRR